MARDDPLAGIDVEGPVLVEVFVPCVRAGAIELTGPCGAAPWYMEKAAGEHPVDVVRRLVADVLGEPALVHSTSWRQSDDGVHNMEASREQVLAMAIGEADQSAAGGVE